MFKSIFAKYITAFMAIIVISFLILMLIITGVVNSYVVNNKRDVLANAAGGMAEFLGAKTQSLADTNFANIINNSLEETDRTLRVFAATGEDVSILIIDNQGNIIRMIDAEGNVSISDVVLPTDLMGESDGKANAEIKRLEGLFDTPHICSVAPVNTSDGHMCGKVLACVSSELQGELLAVMLKTIIVGSLWIILAALIALYFVTDRIIGPLKSMSAMAKEFAEGNFEARAAVRGRDEVARLAEAFNNMADSLSRLETMRNSFIANVSHDLRTPMTTISGFIDNILIGAIPPEKQPYYLEMIRTEVQRLARLVNTLLDISRIQAGERKFVFKSFDICEMARRILISFENKIEAKNLDVSFVCEEERYMTDGDHDAIYQVLYNLCDNAVKFSREGGRLSLSLAEVEDNRIQVSVYNEGEGIVAEDIPYVFERFYKADKSRGLDKSGAGLGLFISKTIIDAHHQKIRVRSRAGEFCEFSFTLSLTQ